MQHQMDDIDHKIMKLLQHDARITISQISKEISMSQPSVKERMTKLEERGIISGYNAVFNLRELNRGTTTFILVKTEHCQELIDFCKAAKEVTDLFRISGEFNYLIKVQSSSVEEIAEFQDSLVKLGPSKSHICMKNILENRVLL
ncbi:AsnC family transcriptional regulator [Paenibacillus jamilae]|uniref:AsnC family transcriptional regulator n=2 Tax=Paenibacillus TaxID=44249 RepID=E3E776_PAEPS|nr:MULTISPECIES: Lrp/AsnC family transcriptional regulator [Paenibacillus]ADO58931.1 AsnC family transcriptional regulator [Paenibacillus polymyxa SC2]AJE52056.1 AsnC family transcriptional regulator [Paenibacillus polymyxa]AUO06832.1 Lrp/AsnC family transcriptional regulator [Paenibacillus sp. lzh-N1]AZH31537.1 Lrp/AsnC family transcriptional regulator [Paenibacillus sp. M-152]KTS82862.1 AsnC family transcriptional regulator [Paenibacillus jamilae]